VVSSFFWITELEAKCVTGALERFGIPAKIKIARKPEEVI